MHVLMIDDNEHDFIWINCLIKISDLTVHRCETVQKGLAYLASHTVDALLLDDRCGLAVLDMTHVQFPALPIIMLSVDDPAHLALEALQHGAQDYLVKGEVDAHRFEKTLWYAVERKQVEEKRRN